MIKRLTISTLAAVSLSGCLSHDLVKDYESKAYNSVSKAVSKYCSPQTTPGLIHAVAEREALEFRREIRQRGTNGPVGPRVDTIRLDEKTANGSGPVLRIYCSDDEVPTDVWSDFVSVSD